MNIPKVDHCIWLMLMGLLKKVGALPNDNVIQCVSIPEHIFLDL